MNRLPLVLLILALLWGLTLPAVSRPPDPAQAEANPFATPLKVGRYEIKNFDEFWSAMATTNNRVEQHKMSMVAAGIPPARRPYHNVTWTRPKVALVLARLSTVNNKFDLYEAETITIHQFARWLRHQRAEFDSQMVKRFAPTELASLGLITITQIANILNPVRPARAEIIPSTITSPSSPKQARQTSTTSPPTGGSPAPPRAAQNVTPPTSALPSTAGSPALLVVSLVLGGLLVTLGGLALGFNLLSTREALTEANTRIDKLTITTKTLEVQLAEANQANQQSMAATQAAETKARDLEQQLQTQGEQHNTSMTALNDQLTTALSEKKKFEAATTAAEGEAALLRANMGHFEDHGLFLVNMYRSYALERERYLHFLLTRLRDLNGAFENYLVYSQTTMAQLNGQVENLTTEGNEYRVQRDVAQTFNMLLLLTVPGFLQRIYDQLEEDLDGEGDLLEQEDGIPTTDDRILTTLVGKADQHDAALDDLDALRPIGRALAGKSNDVIKVVMQTVATLAEADPAKVTEAALWAQMMATGVVTQEQFTSLVDIEASERGLVRNFGEYASLPTTKNTVRVRTLLDNVRQAARERAAASKI